MKVMKFGGTSVGSPEAIRQVASIVAADKETHKNIVVSAPSGVTNILLRSLSEPEALSEVELRIADLADALEVGTECWQPWIEQLNAAQRRDLPDREKADQLASFGEILSAHVIAQYLTRTIGAAKAVDAREFVRTDSQFMDAQVELAVTRERTRELLLPMMEQGILPVVTGFIGADASGRTTTLGRGGSDLTATLIGQCLDADRVEIWSDADGMMSADPREIHDARLLNRISYEEAVECANFGARIIYARALIPAIEGQIPVTIRNTFAPQSPGTCIGHDGDAHNFVVTSQPDITTVTIYNPQMISAVGYLANLFAIFRTHQVAVDMLAASEASVSVTIDHFSSTDTTQLIADLAELGQVSVAKQLSLVAVVSPRMRQSACVADLLALLAKNGVELNMISYGTTKINLALVVEEGQRSKAVRTCHEYLSSITAGEV